MKANIDWVTLDLATGGDLDYTPSNAFEQIADIIEQGVTHIVDLRSEMDDKTIWNAMYPEMVYVHAPTKDIVGHTIPREVFDVVVQTARDAFEAGGKVLVHCHMGINRGPSGAMAVLLDRGMPPIEAFEKVRDARNEAAIYYALDALAADQQRRGMRLNNRQGVIARRKLEQHIETVWTPEEQERISHIVREKHNFDLRSLFT